MKRIYTKLGMFGILVLLMMSLTACQKANSKDESTGVYPPLPAAIADADIKMIDGSTFRLSDKKGKVVLVNLWATWCGPCREEMPTLVEMHDKYRDKGFEVIGLDSDDSESVEMIEEFAKELKLNYPLGYADEALFRQFVRVSGLQGIPQSILINRDGKMTGVFTGGGPKVIGKMKETVDKVVNE